MWMDVPRPAPRPGQFSGLWLASRKWWAGQSHCSAVDRAPSAAGFTGPPVIPTPGLKPRLPSHASLGIGRRDGVVCTGYPRVFSTVSCETSPMPIHSRSARGPVLGWYPLPIPELGPLGIPERKLPNASEAAGCRTQAPRPVEEKPTEEKGVGGGARSSRQREQQIARSQWKPQDEVAPNSLRPMTRQSLQKPISISPGAGAVAAGQRCVCSTQFLRGQPLARLGSVSSPLRTAKPTLRTLPLLAANKRV